MTRGVLDAERLQKALASLGLASRRTAEEWIRAGRLTVNGETATLGMRVGPRDEIRLDGRIVRRRPAPSAGAFLAHRSPGETLQGPADSEEEASLIARMPHRAGRRFVTVSPMPHGDGGLELLAADGDIAARLQRAARATEIEFRVRLHGELSPEGIDVITRGELDSGERLTVLSVQPTGSEAGRNRWYAVVTRGASGRGLRQLFERQGMPVSRILRVRFGSLELDRSLPRGRSRALTPEELARLLPDSPASAPAHPPKAPKRRPPPDRAGKRKRRSRPPAR